jgi:hypothetical protein
VIAAAFIVHWRGAVQWAGDHQVEHDLILSRMLVEIFSEPALGQGRLGQGVVPKRRVEPRRDRCHEVFVALATGAPSPRMKTRIEAVESTGEQRQPPTN